MQKPRNSELFLVVMQYRTEAEVVELFLISLQSLL